MNRDVEALRDAFRGRTQDPAALDACPDPQRIQEAALGLASPAARLAVLDHVSDCAACADAWRLARALETPRTGWRRLQRTAPLAAAAALVLAVSVTQLLPPDRTPYRQADVERPVSLVTDDALPRDAFVLRWRLPSGYRATLLQVLRADLEPVYTLRDPEGDAHRVPRAALAGLASGTIVLWRIEAEGPAGDARASDTFRVTIDGERGSRPGP